MQTGPKFPSIPPPPFSSQTVHPKHDSPSRIDPFFPRRPRTEDQAQSPVKNSHFRLGPSTPFAPSPFPSSNLPAQDRFGRERDGLRTQNDQPYAAREGSRDPRPDGECIFQLEMKELFLCIYNWVTARPLPSRRRVGRAPAHQVNSCATSISATRTMLAALCDLSCRALFLIGDQARVQIGYSIGKCGAERKYT